MIIMQKANIEHRLMMLTHTLQNLTAQSNEESQRLYNEYCNKAMYYYDKDDECEVAVDAINSPEFYHKSQQILSQFHAKERLLEIEKTQLEAQLQSLNTMADGVDKMISDGAKDFAYGG